VEKVLPNDQGCLFTRLLMGENIGLDPKRTLSNSDFLSFGRIFINIIFFVTR